MASQDNDGAADSPWLLEAEGQPAGTEAFSAPGLPQRGQLIADKYRIERLIGRGGMGAVYRATHVVMDKPVALKWLIPDLISAGNARERFLREARAAARIRHPNVVDVYDVGEHAGALYMVMELLEGESLEALIQRAELAIPDLLQLLMRAMQGVAAAHEKGIVHRDIKPENIFVVRDGTQPGGLNAKVFDFGISKLAGEVAHQVGLTRSGAVIGTPLYMSLEQMSGARDVDERTDVYAFGVLLYRALTGRLPFEGESFASLAVAVAVYTPPPPRVLRPGLPRALEDVVLKAMARRREDRYPSLDALLQALAPLRATAATLGQLPAAATLPSTPTPVSRERPRATLLATRDDSGLEAAPADEAPSRPRGLRPLRVAVAILLVAAVLATLTHYLKGSIASDPEHLPESARTLSPERTERPGLDQPAAPETVAREQRETSARERPPSESPGSAAPSQEGAVAPPAADAPPAVASPAAPHDLREKPANKPSRQAAAKRAARVIAPAPSSPIEPTVAPVSKPPPANPAIPAQLETSVSNKAGDARGHRSGGVTLDQL